MFREIGRSERITDICVKKEEPKEYAKIKPVTGMTVEEAKNFWDDLFASLGEEES